MELIATAKPLSQLSAETWPEPFQESKLRNIVRQNKSDIKLFGWCYIHSNDEFDETIKHLCNWHEERVIIDGEVYEGMTKLYGKLKKGEKK